MKKNLILLGIMILSSSFLQAAVINEIVASVGSIAITSYDIQRMRNFDEIITGKKPSSNAALRRLITMSSLLVIAENAPEYYMDEAELRKNINSVTNNPSDPASPQRMQLYNKYPDLYRMMLRTDKVKRGLMYGDTKIKTEVNQPINPKEALAFYNQNKNQFKDSPFPKLNLIIFAVESSSRWSLSELENVETQMANIANDLNTSSDFNALKKKYSKLRLTSFSGVTGLYTPDILILQKKIPDEIIGVALQNTINLGTVSIKISKNKGIYIPQPIPFRNTGIPTYLTFKILNIIQPAQLSFEEAAPKIEEILRYQKAEKLIDKMLKERISAGQITLTPSDNSYQKIFNEFTK